MDEVLSIGAGGAARIGSRGMGAGDGMGGPGLFPLEGEVGDVEPVAVPQLDGARRLVVVGGWMEATAVVESEPGGAEDLGGGPMVGG